MNIDRGLAFFGLVLGWFALLYSAMGSDSLGEGRITWLEGAGLAYLAVSLTTYLLLGSDQSRSKVTERLQQPDYRTTYNFLITPILTLPRDWRLYDWSLLVAVFYPIGSMVFVWAVSGTDGTLGRAVLLPGMPNSDPMILVILYGLSVLLLLFHRSISFRLSKTRRSASIAFQLSVIVLAFLFISSIQSISALVGLFNISILTQKKYVLSVLPLMLQCFFAVWVVLILGMPVRRLGIFSASVAILIGHGIFISGVSQFTLFIIMFTSSLLIALICDWAIEKTEGRIIYIAFTTLCGLGLVFSHSYLQLYEFEEYPVFLFLAVLPLLNAIFDYASYFATLTLIRWGARSGWGAALIGAFDLILALILFTLSGLTMLTVVAGAHWLSGVQLYPLEPLFDGLRDPAQIWSYLWVYLMLFSTILPTLLHFGLATFALSGVFPLGWRQGLVSLINSPDIAQTTAAPFVVGALWSISAALPFAAMYGLYRLVAAAYPDILLTYLTLFEGWARLLGQLPAA